MQRNRFAAVLLALSVSCNAQAQTRLCQAVANHLWTRVAVAPLQAQTPLAELSVAAPASFKMGGDGLAGFGQTISDALVQDHGADADLKKRLQDLAPNEAMRLGQSRVWLLDGVEGTLGCHTPMVVVVPAGGSAHEIALPGNPDPSSLCGLSALVSVQIDGSPAIWIEQSGAFSNAVGQSTISIAGLHDEKFEPPCSITIDYDVADRATHAFCDGVDCVPLIRRAELLAMRLRQQEPAESLGVGVLLDEEDGADYRRMREIVDADTQPTELPTFGVSLDTPYMTFTDQVVFPIRLDDGGIYLARMGHGSVGFRQSADTLLVVYRLHEDKLVPVASIYIGARRVGIESVEVR